MLSHAAVEREDRQTVLELSIRSSKDGLTALCVFGHVQLRPLDLHPGDLKYQLVQNALVVIASREFRPDLVA